MVGGTGVGDGRHSFEAGAEGQERREIQRDQGGHLPLVATEMS